MVSRSSVLSSLQATKFLDSRGAWVENTGAFHVKGLCFVWLLA